MQPATRPDRRRGRRWIDDVVAEADSGSESNTLRLPDEKGLGSFVDLDAGDIRRSQLAADGGAAVDDGDVCRAVAQRVRSSEPGDPGADDDDVTHQREATSRASAAITGGDVVTDGVRANGRPSDSANDAASMSTS